MTYNTKRYLTEWGIILLILSTLFCGWWFWYRSQENLSQTGTDLNVYEIEGRFSIPYFLLALDRSTSMEQTDSDPENFEKEALKQVLRLIYWNGLHLKEATGHFPKIQIITFSGSPIPLNKNDAWTELTSEDDILKLDSAIDEALSKRTGQFTDLNSVFDYVNQSWSTIPRILGEGKRAYPVSMISILFTDGEIYPNYLNKINHPNLSDWYDYVKSSDKLVSIYFNSRQIEKFNNLVIESEWFDPIDWANSNKVQKGFTSEYYQMNEAYGISNEARFEYAKNTVQEELLAELAQKNFPPIRLNVVALIKGECRNREEEYLESWTKKLGFYYLIKNAESLGEVFIKIMSGYLNSYSETFSLNGSKKFKPFPEDVEAAELTIIFPDKLTVKDQERFVRLVSPDGTGIKSNLNQNLERSRSYYISGKDYQDFHDSRGWTLNVNPIQVDDKIYEGIKCFLVTIHDYIFTVRPDTVSQNTNNVRHVASLIKLKDRKIIPLDDFEDPLLVNATPLDPRSTLPPVKLSINYKMNGVNIDFMDWPSGEYDIRFTLIGGRLKGEELPLKNRSLIKTIHIGESIILYDRGGRRINSITFENLDRK